MPGLSQYAPNRLDSSDTLSPGEDLRPDEPSLSAVPGIFDKMHQRYLDSMGFADLKRTAPDWMMQEMMRNIPRSEWNKQRMFRYPIGEPNEILPGVYDQAYDTQGPYTLRQLMDALGKMNSTNEQQAP